MLASLAGKNCDSILQGPGFKSCLRHLLFALNKNFVSMRMLAIVKQYSGCMTRMSIQSIRGLI